MVLVMRNDSYERRQDALALLRILELGNRQIEKGWVQPATDDRTPPGAATGSVIPDLGWAAAAMHDRGPLTMNQGDPA